MGIMKRGGEKFSPRQREILINITDTILPPEVGTPFRATEDNLIIPAEDFLRGLGSNTVRGFGLLLYFFEYAAIFFYPFFRKFTKLSYEHRVRYLEGWEKSRIGLRLQIFTLLKFIPCLCMLSDKDIRAALGYDPGCLVEMGK